MDHRALLTGALSLGIAQFPLRLGNAASLLMKAALSREVALLQEMVDWPPAKMGLTIAEARGIGAEAP